jgi:hypothetical protein
VLLIARDRHVQHVRDGVRNLPSAAKANHEEPRRSSVCRALSSAGLTGPGHDRRAVRSQADVARPERRTAELASVVDQERRLRRRRGLRAALVFRPSGPAGSRSPAISSAASSRRASDHGHMITPRGAEFHCPADERACDSAQIDVAAHPSRGRRAARATVTISVDRLTTWAREEGSAGWGVCSQCLPGSPRESRWC